MCNFIRCEESGQAMVEYTVIIALIALACIAVFGGMGDAVRDFLAGGKSQPGPPPGPPPCERTQSCLVE